MKKLLPLFLLPISLFAGPIDLRDSIDNIEAAINEMFEEFPDIYYYFRMMAVDPCIYEIQDCIDDIKVTTKGSESSIRELLDLMRKLEGGSKECLLLPCEVREAINSITDEIDDLETFLLLQH